MSTIDLRHDDVQRRVADVVPVPVAVPDGARVPAGTTARDELERLRVRPARHPGRWVATAAVAVLLAMVVSSLLSNDKWGWEVVGHGKIRTRGSDPAHTAGFPRRDSSPLPPGYRGGP